MLKVYKQEKDLARRRPVPFKDSGSIHSSLCHVDSIAEHDELAFSQSPVPTFPRPRQGSAVTRAVIAAVTRPRSLSVSTSGSRSVSSLLRNKSAAPPAYHHHPSNMTRLSKVEFNGLPPRTHKRQGNRESQDLNDVMNGSQGVKHPTRPPLLARGSSPVSPSTRDLMDFLAQGPPDDHSAPVDAKPKKDRIKKMISILSIGSGDKSKALSKSQSPTVIAYTLPRPPRPADLNTRPALASLANRPIPPRLPRPPTPPPDCEISPPPSPVKTSAPVAPHSSTTGSLRDSNWPPSPALVPSQLSRDNCRTSRQTSTNASLDTSPNAYTNGHASRQINGTTPKSATNDLLIHDTNQVVFPSPLHDGLSPSATSHLYHLFQRATSASECRLILHALLAKHKISPQLWDAPEPTPSQPVASPEDVALEQYLTGYFLGEEAPSRESSFRVISNCLSATSFTSNATCEDDSGVDATPPGLSSLSIDSSNNTLVGEMKAY